jgi:hypothetical protein
VSKSGSLHGAERTSMRRAAVSLMGEMRRSFDLVPGLDGCECNNAQRAA